MSEANKQADKDFGSRHCSTAAVVVRLEQALAAAAEDDIGDSESGGNLLAAAGEALGALRVVGGVSMSQLLYDFARLAGHAGHVPDDFEGKSNR